MQAFEAIDDQALVLRANWAIREGQIGGQSWSGHFTTRRSVAGGGADSVVTAHNEAIALLADAVAQRIERIAAEAAAGEETADQPSG